MGYAPDTLHTSQPALRFEHVGHGRGDIVGVPSIFQEGHFAISQGNMAHNGTHGLYVVDYEIARANMNSTVVTEAV
jgi:hypothetical protein